MKKIAIWISLLAAAVLPARADLRTATVATGTTPFAVAVNPITGKTYVANYGSDNVTVIDGRSYAVTTVAVGDAPRAVAINPLTNRIYVANSGSSNTVTVIDGTADTVLATVPARLYPQALAVNPVTNKIYVANYQDNSITIINGATNDTSLVPTYAAGPYAVAVNSVTNKVYVANINGGSLTVMDGATNAVEMTVVVGGSPRSVAVNPLTNKIYLPNETSNPGTVDIIDGATLAVTSVGAGSFPRYVAVNPVTNKAYVVNAGGARVTVIDGATGDTASVATLADPAALAVNPATNKIYVANSSAGDVTVIDGATNAAANVITLGAGHQAVAVNPVTNRAFFLDMSSHNVKVVDGSTYNGTATLAAGSQPVAVAVNPVTGKVYWANTSSSNITIYNPATGARSNLAVGSSPLDVAVNPVTNRVYVSCASNLVYVINGATDAVITFISSGGGYPRALAVNPVTNKIYLACYSSNLVTIIDGATHARSSLPVGQYPYALAVNVATNKVYVTNRNTSYITVIDGATNALSTITVGGDPTSVDVNPLTNMIYVANYGNGTMTRINGATGATVSRYTGGAPFALAVNPVTDRVFVVNYNNASMAVFNGTTLDTNMVGVGGSPYAVAVNQVSNKVYVPCQASNYVNIIDGATRAKNYAFTGAQPIDVAVDPVSNRAYTANYGSNSFTVIDEVREWETGLQAAVGYIPGHLCYSSRPDIYGTAVMDWGPASTRLEGVLDKWQSVQGPWERAATGLGKATIDNWQYAWGTDSLIWGENFLNVVPLESQCATGNNLGLGTPFAGDLLTYPAYYMDNLPPAVPVLSLPANKTVARDSFYYFRWRKPSDNYSMGKRYQFQYALDQEFSLGLYDTVATDTVIYRKLPTSDTLYFWRVRAVDAAGNIGPWSEPWSVELDLSAPAGPALVAPYDLDWFRDTLVVFAWTEMGKGAEVRYIKQLDTLNSFTSGYRKTDTTALTLDTMLLTRQGVYYWRVRAYDLAGNSGSFSDYRTFGIDFSAPSTFDLVSPPHLSTVTPRPGLVWSAAADIPSGVAAYELYLNGTLKYRGSDTSWTSDSLANGSYHWYVRAVDQAANATLSDQAWDFQVQAPLAVRLTSLSAGQAGDKVEISWRTESEHNSVWWVVERQSPGQFGYQAIGQLEARGSASEPCDYLFSDGGLLDDGEQLYRIAEVDGDGRLTYFGPVGVVYRSLAPKAFALQPAYPNPSRGQTTFSYQLPKAAPVALTVYDLTGREVKRYDQGTLPAGHHQILWQAPKTLANGVYFYRLTAGSFTAIRKLLVVR